MSTTEKRDRAFARDAGVVEHYFWRAVEAQRQEERRRERRNMIAWAIIGIVLAAFWIAFLLAARWAIGGGRWT